MENIIKYIKAYEMGLIDKKESLEAIKNYAENEINKKINERIVIIEDNRKIRGCK